MEDKRHGRTMSQFPEPTRTDPSLCTVSPRSDARRPTTLVTSQVGLTPCLRSSGEPGPSR